MPLVSGFVSFLTGGPQRICFWLTKSNQNKNSKGYYVWNQWGGWSNQKENSGPMQRGYVTVAAKTLELI